MASDPLLAHHAKCFLICIPSRLRAASLVLDVSFLVCAVRVTRPSFVSRLLHQMFHFSHLFHFAPCLAVGRPYHRFWLGLRAAWLMTLCARLKSRKAERVPCVMVNVSYFAFRGQTLAPPNLFGGRALSLSVALCMISCGSCYMFRVPCFASRVLCEVFHISRSFPRVSASCLKSCVLHLAFIVPYVWPRAFCFDLVVLCLMSHLWRLEWNTLFSSVLYLAFRVLLFHSRALVS